MYKVSDAVERIIIEKPFLEVGLQEGVINLTALAKSIQKDVSTITQKPVKIGAIVMALKRLSPTIKAKSIRAVQIVSQIEDITVKSNLIDYTFKKTPSITKSLVDEMFTLKNNPDSFLTIIQGVHEISIILESKSEHQLDNLRKNEELRMKITNLSAIVVGLPEANVYTPGVYYHILKQLAWNNVNLIDAVSTANEITMFFFDEDIEKAFITLKGLTHN